MTFTRLVTEPSGMGRHRGTAWPFSLPQGEVLRGWARSTSGDTAEGISRIEDAIRAFRANGSILGEPLLLALKAEALFLADCASEALDTVKEALAPAERFEQRFVLSRLHRLSAMYFSRLWVV